MSPWATRSRSWTAHWYATDLFDHAPAGSAKGAAPAEAAKNRAAAKTRTAKAKPAVCHECGTVESIESFTEKGQASGGGAIAGGVIGGIIGRQIGAGRGKDQIEDYACRKGMKLATLERWLSPHLGYEPQE